MPTIPIGQLHAHPHNPNHMPEALVRKLAHHIQRTGQYPPIIVRPIVADNKTSELDNQATPDAESQAPVYQILDGHHRVIALKRLGHDMANCEVWQVDDAQALTFVATLNRLHGEDDPRKRGELVHELTQRLDWKTLVDRLPDDQPRLKKLLQIHREPPQILSPEPIGQMPVAVHFFLLPNQRHTLETRLREIGGNREHALMSLINS